MFGFGEEKEDATPMNSEEIKVAQEAVERIGRGEQNGFFVVIERHEINDDVSRAVGTGKVTNTNNKFIIESVMSSIGIDDEMLMRYLLLKKMAEHD